MLDDLHQVIYRDAQVLGNAAGRLQTGSALAAKDPRHVGQREVRAPSDIGQRELYTPTITEVSGETFSGLGLTAMDLSLDLRLG